MNKNVDMISLCKIAGNFEDKKDNTGQYYDTVGSDPSMHPAMKFSRKIQQANM